MKAGEEIFIRYKGKYWQQRRGTKVTAEKEGHSGKADVTQYHNATEEPACEQVTKQSEQPIEGVPDEIRSLVVEAERLRSGRVPQEMRPDSEMKPDGLAYIGKEAHTHVRSCQFKFSEKIADSYITTAALRRSGCHPESATAKPEKDEHGTRKENSDPA